MKKCPLCKTEYVDNKLKFCLEDGERLLRIEALSDDSTTVANYNSLSQKKTEQLPFNIEKNSSVLSINSPVNENSKTINRVRRSNSRLCKKYGNFSNRGCSDSFCIGA